MERINHPNSGEVGYFCTIKMKSMIDAILCQYHEDGNSQIEASSDARGVEL